MSKIAWSTQDGSLHDYIQTTFDLFVKFISKLIVTGNIQNNLQFSLCASKLKILLAKNWEIAISNLAGNLNSCLSYLIKTVKEGSWNSKSGLDIIVIGTLISQGS